MTLQHLARTIAKARHGTDAMWANYMGAAEAVSELYAPQVEAATGARDSLEQIMFATPTDAIPIARRAIDLIDVALLAQPDGVQQGGG